MSSTAYSSAAPMQRQRDLGSGVPANNRQNTNERPVNVTQRTQLLTQHPNVVGNVTRPVSPRQIRSEAIPSLARLTVGNLTPPLAKWARMLAGSDKHQKGKVCDLYNQEKDCFGDETGDNKILQIQFLVLGIEPHDPEFTKALVENRDLLLRYTCPPFARREVELNACKLKRAPLESGYFDACFRCTRPVFDDIMCKYKPDIRMSIVTPKFTARGNYPFRKAYAEPQTKIALGDWGFKHRTVTAITLLEEVECRPVAKAYVDIIINDIKGGMRKTEFIPYKPAIDICNAVHGKRMARLATFANFKMMTEAQACSATYQHSRVVLRREHRMLFLDALLDMRHKMLVAIAKLLNSVADGPPLEILCDDDLFEEGEDGWTEPGDKCWWSSLEEALADGPIFEESDEACACTNPGGDAPGSSKPKPMSPEAQEAEEAAQKRACRKLNQVNQHFFGYFNCILNITRSGAMHPRSHPIYKSIRNILEIAEHVYRQLGPKLPTHQKGPLYIRDPDRFFMEHLEVFVGILGTALIMSTTSFPCASQDLAAPTDHKIVLTNLKFAGVFRQTMERLLESPPKAIVTRQHLLQRYRHPANELMMFPMMQSLIDFKTLVENYCIENVPLFAEEDLEEVEEQLIFFQLLLSVLSRDIVACWITDKLNPRYKVLQQDFPHLIAYEPDYEKVPRDPPPPELKRNRADAPRRLREFIKFTEDHSTFMKPIAKMAARLHRSGQQREALSDEDDGQPKGIITGMEGVETAAEIFSTLPGFQKLSRQIGTGLDKPKLEEKEEAYEWEIDAECPEQRPRPVQLVKPQPTADEMVEISKAKARAQEERDAQQRVASRVLTQPVQAVGATIEMLKSFPPPMLNRATTAVDRFPGNVPGVYDKKADVTEARMGHTTTLDTRMNRHVKPQKVKLGDQCQDPKIVKERKRSKKDERSTGGDDSGIGPATHRR